MAQVVARDGTRLLLFTRTAIRPGVDSVQYGRILDLATMRMWPELPLDSIVAHTGPGWVPLDDPVPADALLAHVKVQPLG